MANVTNKELQQQLADTNARMDKLFDMIESRAAKDTPVSTTKPESDAANMEIEQPEELTAESLEREIEPVRGTVDDLGFNDKMERMRFDNEELIIRVHPTSDPDADPMVPVSVNGRQVFIPRGVPTKIKRCYVGVLAASKPIHYSNQQYTKHEGDTSYASYKYPAHTGLRFPFEVMKDPSGARGRQWLEQALRA